MTDGENTGYETAAGGSGGDHGWKSWPDVPPGQLKHEIAEAFANAAAGTYPALEVKVENPITGYRVMRPGGG